jgi:hypothetical protein
VIDKSIQKSEEIVKAKEKEVWKSEIYIKSQSQTNSKLTFNDRNIAPWRSLGFWSLSYLVLGV